MKPKTKKVLILSIIILLTIVLYKIFIDSNETNIGEDDTGYVTRQTFNYYNSEDTIVLIAGIHPRETLAIEPEIEAARNFALKNRVKVVVYHVVVTKDATDYKQSRYNGEHLVANYVIPDLGNGNSPVIISHSHISSYGEGYYIATPAMDMESVRIAKTIKDSGNDFNYYPVTGKESYNSTSAILASKPLANNGHPTFVYEIPENITSMDSTSRTYELFKLIYENK